MTATKATARTEVFWAKVEAEMEKAFLQPMLRRMREVVDAHNSAKG